MSPSAIGFFVLAGCAPETTENPPVCTDTFFADADADGHGDPLVSAAACTAPEGYLRSADDCDDTNAAVHPGADEVCNEADDDCDSAIDDEAIDAVTWYADADVDGYGDDGTTTRACQQPADHVANGGDCADDDHEVHPEADELCNAIDDDCDGLVDSLDPSLTQGTVWYADADDDGYGDPATGAHACEAPADRITEAGDCDDSNASVHPGVDEICNGVDDECDGLVDEDDDSLLDGVPFYADTDGDGFGDAAVMVTACSAPSGYASEPNDCDDADALVGASPDYYNDADGDGYGNGAVIHTCAPTADLALVDGDCRPSQAAVNPGATESCNGADDNCDGLVDEDDPLLVADTWYADDDGDEYGDPSDTVVKCDTVAGYVADATDCDDSDAAIHPDGLEQCDGADNDCDGAVDDSVAYSDWYADTDSDGYGDPDVVKNECAQPSGYVIETGDCDDTTATTHPGATELCTNSTDDDCDGLPDNCVLAATEADVTIAPPDADCMGWPIEIADADADGVADLLLGAYQQDGLRGAVYVAYGPYSAPDTTVVLSSATVDTWFGWDVDGGDANDDGSDDVLVGAMWDAADAAYLFLGPVTADRSDTDADVVLAGDAGTRTGADVAVVLDFDGGGHADLAVGATHAGDLGPPSAYTERGAVYVVAGPASGAIDLVSAATYEFEGADRADHLGDEIVSIADADGDGVGDLAMNDGDGRVYVVAGGAAPGSYDVDAVALASLSGEAFSFGFSVASVDYDGDGADDLLVGSPYEDSPFDISGGAVYAFLGPLSGTLRTGDADVSWIPGDSDVRLLGYDVAAGDVDGDKSVDVLMGAACTGSSCEGAAFLQLGKASGAVEVGTLRSVRGAPWEYLGTSVALVPDWTGDGGDELATGMPLHSVGMHQTGGAAVFFSEGLAP